MQRERPGHAILMVLTTLPSMWARKMAKHSIASSLVCTIAERMPFIKSTKSTTLASTGKDPGFGKAMGKPDALIVQATIIDKV